MCGGRLKKKSDKDGKYDKRQMEENNKETVRRKRDEEAEGR